MHPRGFDRLIVAARLPIACARPACRSWSSSCSLDIHTSLTVVGTRKGPLCCLISIDTYDAGLELNVFSMVPQL